MVMEPFLIECLPTTKQLSEMTTTDLSSVCRTCFNEIIQGNTISIYNIVSVGIASDEENNQTDVDKQLTVRILDIILLCTANITVNK